MTIGFNWYINKTLTVYYLKFNKRGIKNIIHRRKQKVYFRVFYVHLSQFFCELMSRGFLNKVKINDLSVSQQNSLTTACTYDLLSLVSLVIRL